jgi:hypothetical protein
MTTALDCCDVHSPPGTSEGYHKLDGVCDAQCVTNLPDPFPPRGSLAFAVVVTAEARAAELFALALDPERLREVDPRLREASWTSPGPAVGALATVRTDVAFAHAWVGRMIGEQRGTIRILELTPNQRIGCLCEHDRGLAYLRVTFEGSGQCCTLRFSGWIKAHRAKTHNTTRLLAPLIVLLIEHCLRRSTDRACRYARRQRAAARGLALEAARSAR